MDIVNTTDIHRILFTEDVQIKCHKCSIINNEGKQWPLFFSAFYQMLIRGSQ